MMKKDITPDRVVAIRTVDRDKVDAGADPWDATKEVRAIVIGRQRGTDHWDVVTEDGPMSVRYAQIIAPWEDYMARVNATGAADAVINAFEDAGWIAPDPDTPDSIMHRVAILAGNDATATVRNGRIVITVTPDMAWQIADGIRHAATDMDTASPHT